MAVRTRKYPAVAAAGLRYAECQRLWENERHAQGGKGVKLGFATYLRFDSPVVKPGLGKASFCLAYRDTPVLRFDPDGAVGYTPDGRLTAAVLKKYRDFAPHSVRQMIGRWWVGGLLGWWVGFDRRGPWNGGPGQREDRSEVWFYSWGAFSGWLPVERWLTDLPAGHPVRVMARGIKADDGYDRCPILADLMDESGCPSEELTGFIRRTTHKNNVIHDLACRSS